MKTIGYPNTKARRLWNYTRQKSLNVYGRSDLASSRHFSKKTKTGLKRRKVRASELKADRASLRRQQSPFRKHGIRGLGLGASATYGNTMRLRKGYS